jgi:precorrin-6Y C5,15-methyltransferase (decarboxylating)
VSERITVVGIGADGWDGLTQQAQDAIRAAEVLLGSKRQLDLVPDSPAERVPWPSPLLPALPDLIDTERPTVVLASGDPTFHGIGTTLTRLFGAVHVLPHSSSVSLACARLGWAQDQVAVVSLVGRPVELLHPHVQPNRHILVLGTETRVGEVAALLTDRGYGGSALTVLERLGAVDERVRPYDGTEPDPLNVLAIECSNDPGVTVLPVVPGLPDGAFENDGQLTKREMRAVALSRLAPVPGQLLWDVGAGAGSIAIEWMRSHPSCRAIAIESHPDRARRIQSNATALGVPGLTLVEGTAPDALSDLDQPDAVFVGGGASETGVLETCWHALRPGGRLVVSAVTLETEAVLGDWYARHGGDLVRIGVQRATAIGGMTGWRPAMPVTIWSVVR